MGHSLSSVYQVNFFFLWGKGASVYKSMNNKKVHELVYLLSSSFIFLGKE